MIEVAGCHGYLGGANRERGGPGGAGGPAGRDVSAHGIPVVTPLRGAAARRGGTGGGEADFGGSELARRPRAARAAHRDPTPLPGDGPLLHPARRARNRAATPLALGLFGLLHWMQMVEPNAKVRALGRGRRDDRRDGRPVRGRLCCRGSRAQIARRSWCFVAGASPSP